MSKEITITAVWLRQIGSLVEVLVEIPGRGWCMAITEHKDAAFSHCAHANAAKDWPIDYLEKPPAGRGHVMRLPKG